MIVIGEENIGSHTWKENIQGTFKTKLLQAIDC